MFISEVKTSISSISGNNKEKTIIKDDLFDVEMKNNDNNNNNTTTSEEFNSIKVIKSKIFNDQRTNEKKEFI